jgi:DNA-binding response OmpR family regulator
MLDDQQHLSTETGVRAKTVLLVEDDLDIGEFLLQIIGEETSFHALLASDAFEALRLIHEITPDLFLLDYQLPRMNGIELYDQLHRTKGLEDIPALMISARLPKQDIEKRSIRGMNKPFELNELLETLETLLA